MLCFFCEPRIVVIHHSRATTGRPDSVVIVPSKNNFSLALNAEAVEAAACKPVLSQFESGSVLQWAGGGMADTLVLGTSAFGRESSSLSWPTNN